MLPRSRPPAFRSARRPSSSSAAGRQAIASRPARRRPPSRSGTAPSLPTRYCSISTVPCTCSRIARGRICPTSSAGEECLGRHERRDGRLAHTQPGHDDRDRDRGPGMGTAVARRRRPSARPVEPPQDRAAQRRHRHSFHYCASWAAQASARRWSKSCSRRALAKNRFHSHWCRSGRPAGCRQRVDDGRPTSGTERRQGDATQPFASR